MNVFDKKQELYNEIGNLREEFLLLVNLCTELGKEDYANSVVVKSVMKRLEEKEQELEDLKEIMREEFSN